MKQMEKNLTLRLNEEQVNKLDEVRKHTREATYIDWLIKNRVWDIFYSLYIR